MTSLTDRIDALDVTLFDHVASETDAGDRRSLLAVQRATAARHGAYAYVEIGSHLGGSIQPHLVDDRCTAIYSIDPRPTSLPDDRTPGHVVYYDGNSSARMLEGLAAIGAGDVGKIDCIESDASAIAPGRVPAGPQLAFIDGEHTATAVRSDFAFCRGVVTDDATILFHDFFIMGDAILDLVRDLDRAGGDHVPVKLEGSVFAIFLDRTLVESDPYLAKLEQEYAAFAKRYRRRAAIKRLLPDALTGAIRKARTR